MSQSWAEHTAEICELVARIRQDRMPDKGARLRNGGPRRDLRVLEPLHPDLFVLSTQARGDVSSRRRQTRGRPLVRELLMCWRKIFFGFFFFSYLQKKA